MNMTVSNEEKQDENIQNNISMSTESKPDGNNLNNITVSAESKLDKNHQNNITVLSENKEEENIEKNATFSNGNKEDEMVEAFSVDCKQDGSRIVQYVAGMTSNIGIICSEMHFGWTSPFLPVLISGNYYFVLTDEEASYLTITPLIGSIVGAIITWITVDTYGRQKLLTYSSIPFIASWLLVGIARSSVLMFVGRFFGGISMAITFIVVPLYLGEIADTTTKGPLSCMCQICAVFGLLLVNFVGTVLRLDTVAYLSACLPILLLLFFSYMPESPYFRLMKNDPDGARISLQTLRGQREIFEELERMSEAVKEENERKGKWSDLITISSYRKTFILALGLRGFQQLSGISAITFYCQNLFDESKDFISPKIAAILFFLIQLIFLTLSLYWFDITRRKTLLIISTVGTTLTLLSNGIYYFLKTCTNVNMERLEFIIILSLLAFIIVFSMGLQSIPHFIIEESFPAKIKSTALCLMNFYFDITVISISIFFNWSMDDYGIHVPILVFASLSFLGIIFVLFLFPETKRKKLEKTKEELSERTISEMKC